MCFNKTIIGLEITQKKAVIVSRPVVFKISIFKQ